MQPVQPMEASLETPLQPQPSVLRRRSVTHPQLSRVPDPVRINISLPTPLQDLFALSADEKKQRVAMLRDLQASQERPLDADKAKDAFKLRKFAEARYRKNVFSRLTHKILLLRPPKAQLEELKTMEVDTLIRRVRQGSLRCSRTLLTDVAKHHLVTALNFDQNAYEKGVRHMAVWEGVHSTVGRGVTFAGSSIAFGVAPVVAAIGTATAGAVAKAMKLLGHQLPTAVINPIVTGFLRSSTDVRKSGRNGGISKVAKNIENVASLRDIRTAIRLQNQALQKLLRERHAPANVEQLENGRTVLRQVYLQKICAGFLKTYAAQEAYKERMGSAKAHTWSKGYGMGVNAIATSAQAAGLVFPPAIPISLGIQGLCIPLQFGAGYLDLHTAQRYNFRANMKYARVLTEEARHLPAEQLQASHIDMGRLRELFQPAEVQKLELIREIYTDELGELHFAKDRVDQALKKLAFESGARRDRSMVEKRAELSRITREIQRSEIEIRHFESFNEKGWESLPLDSTIGRCLDDRQYLVKRAQEARKRKPGEIAAQIWQRYKQMYGDGPAAAGFLMPTLDVSLNLDSSLSGHLDTDRLPEAGVPAGLGAAIAAATFTAGTGQVRSGKAEDKRDLAKAIKTRKAIEQHETLKTAWAVPLNESGKTIDLSHTAAFDRTLHTRSQRVWRFVKIMPRGLFASQRALYQTVRVRRVRQQAKATLAETLEVLHAENQWVATRTARNVPMAGLKEEFLSLSQVRASLALPPGVATEGEAEENVTPNEETLVKTA